MFKLVENNSYNNNVDIIKEFDCFAELYEYLTINFGFDSWNYVKYLECSQESEEDENIIDTFQYLGINDAFNMADLFESGKVILYKMFNYENGETKAIVTDDLLVCDINYLLSVYGEVTTPAGVKNQFEVIE